MKSAKIKKTVFTINQDASDVLFPEMCQTIQTMKVILNLYEATTEVEFRQGMLIRLSKELEKFLRLYKDKKITLPFLKKELEVPFLEEPKKKSVIKKVITHLLIDLAILLDAIMHKEDEVFKTLLAMCDQKSLQMIQFKQTVQIVGNNQNYYLFYSLLSYTACYGTLDMVSTLKQKGYPLFPLNSSYAEPVTNPITVMIHQALSDEVEIMDRCRTLLAEMSVYNRAKCLKVFTQGDTYTSHYLPSPLYSALLKRYDKLAMFLLQEGADAGQLSCQAPDKQPHYPIELIVQKDRAALLKYIPNEDLRVLMKKDLLGLTVFQWAIVDLSAACLKYLLQMDMVTNVDAEAGIQKYTALMAAAYTNDTKLARVLLQKGADFVKTNLAGHTALNIAVQEGSYDVTKLLLSCRAGSNQQSSLSLKTTPLNLAVVKKHYKIMKLLISEGVFPDESDRYGNTPVGLALANGDDVAMKILVDAGINLYEHRSQLLSLAESEYSPSLLSVAEYAFFFNHELLRYLCKAGKFDLKQKCDEKWCFYDYLSMDNVQLLKYSTGKAEEFTFDSEKVIEIILSAMPKVSDDNSSVQASSEVLHKSLATEQQNPPKEAVLTAESHQKEEEIQKRIHAKNKELTEARKLKRQQRASRSTPLFLKKKTEHKQQKTQSYCSTSSPLSSPTVSSASVAIPTSLSVNQDPVCRRSRTFDTYPSLVPAMYPLEKKDRWVSEELPKPMKVSGSKRNKSSELANDTSHLLRFHRTLPRQMAQSEALLVSSHSRVVDTIACLRALAVLDGYAEPSSARLVSLAALQHILVLTNFYCGLKKQYSLFIAVEQQDDITALRDVLAHAYHLPPEKDILNAIQAFIKAFPFGSDALDIQTLAALFQKTIGLSLLLFYPPKQDSMGEQDFLMSHSRIHHAFYLLKASYQQGERFYSCELNPAFNFLFVAAYSLRKALNLTSKQDSFFRLWRNLLAHDVSTACEKTFQTMGCLDALLAELNQHRLVDDSLLLQINGWAISTDPVRERVDDFQLGYSLWRRGAACLFQSANAEDTNTECAQIKLSMLPAK